ncbi:HTH_Tnp_Tc3_2 domain-containing protein [Trichonephila clavipes]|nr:HTH_Tnp_Tc3_2 domain-containing protein [Trichonephila clavipes]
MNQGATNSGFQTTVQRSLLHLVLRSRRLVHAPMLTAVHQQRRLEFSHRYRNWASMRGDRMVASTSRTLRSVIQLTAYVRGSKSTRISLSFFRVQKNSPDLNPINNLWNHLDRVVRAMDSHARNLEQQ